jgi:phenolic acid decarboxylase
MDELAGEVLLVSVDNGALYRNSYSADGEYITWQGLAGPDKGRRETNQVHRVRLTPGVFFLNWIESDSTTVSTVLNLTTMTAEVFWTMAGTPSRTGQLHTAKLRFA